MGYLFQFCGSDLSAIYFILILLMITQAVYANIQNPDYAVQLKMMQYF